MELQRLVKSRASIVSGVSWHATSAFFGFNLACNVFFSFKFGDMAEI
jgi:hypothetical protein